MPLTPGKRPSLPGVAGDHEARIRALERQRVGVRMPNVDIRVNLNGVTFNNGVDEQISFDNLLAVPINNGGTIDTNVFDLDGAGPWDHITILQPGTYYAEARCGWYRDWGKARINLLFAHSSGAVFPVSDSYGFTASLPSEPGVTFNPIGTEIHEQTACARRGFIMVDEYAGTVDLWAEFTNNGGTNRTFNNTTNIGGAQLFVLQVSGSGHANPP